MKSRNHQFNRLRRRIRRNRNTNNRKPWESGDKQDSTSDSEQSQPDSFLKILR